jgi:hypothetical protein
LGEEINRDEGDEEAREFGLQIKNRVSKKKPDFT